MNFFGKSQVLHHFKICFPIPVEKVQNCLKQIQNLNRAKTSAICVSFNGHSESPESCQLLHDSLLTVRELNRLPIITFLEDKATSLTYFTAASGQNLIANPYSLIGDVGVTQKSYRNVKKLLDLIGLKYEQMGTKHQSSQLWNQFVQKSERQKEITKKWLTVVESKMISQISKRRKISIQNVAAIKNKVFHPKDALQHKLIDSISTFEEYKAVYFPNHSVEDVVYRIDGTRLKKTLTQRQLSALSTFMQVLEMPNVAMFSSEDLVQQSIRQIISLLEARLIKQEGLQELDSLLEDLFTRFSGKLSTSFELF